MRSHTLFCLLLLACEPPLPSTNDSGSVPDAINQPDASLGRISNELVGTATMSTVDATNSKIWVSLDLDTGQETRFEKDTWDLALSRFHIRARGGASGTGQVGVAVVTNAKFEEVTSVPNDLFLEDQPDGPDNNTDIDTVISTQAPWYAYNPMTHVLSPNGQVYVVRTDSKAFFKLSVESYYDAAGTPGIVKLRWARL